MKNFLVFICLLFLLSACQKDFVSDKQAEFFTKYFGTYLNDQGSEVETTSDGGYVFVGTSEHHRTGNTIDTDMTLVKTDKFGNMNSSSPMLLGGSDETVNLGGDPETDEVSAAMEVLGDGIYLVTGSAYKSGIKKIVLAKIGSDGKIWSTITGANNQNQTPLDLLALDNEYIVTGKYSTLSDPSVTQSFIQKFSLTGDSVARSTYSNLSYLNSIVYLNPGFLALGTSSSNMLTLVSLNNAININSENYLDSYEITNVTPSKLIKSSNNTFYILGTIRTSGTGKTGIYVKKINSDLTINEGFGHNPLSDSNADLTAVDIIAGSDGNLVVLGNRTESGNTDIVLYILNADDGTILSQKEFGGTGNQSATSLKLAADGGLIILGSNQVETNNMVSLIRTDAVGNIW